MYIFRMITTGRTRFNPGRGTSAGGGNPRWRRRAVGRPTRSVGSAVVRDRRSRYRGIFAASLVWRGREWTRSVAGPADAGDGGRGFPRRASCRAGAHVRSDAPGSGRDACSRRGLRCWCTVLLCCSTAVMKGKGWAMAPSWFCLHAAVMHAVGRVWDSRKPLPSLPATLGLSLVGILNQQKGHAAEGCYDTEACSWSIVGAQCTVPCRRRRRIYSICRVCPLQNTATNSAAAATRQHGCFGSKTNPFFFCGSEHCCCP